MEENKEPHVYRRREDGIVITNPQDLAYYKMCQQEEIRANLLLGSYNEKGEYIIDQTFVKELINCNKMIKENFDNSYLIIARSNRGVKFNLKFTLVISKDEATHKKIATLKLFESLVKPDGITTDNISTVIARYKDDDDIYFFQKIKKIFHLSTVDDSDGNELIDETVIAEILKRKLFLNEMNGKTISFADKLAKIYIERVMKVLIVSGEFGKYVMINYREFLKTLGDPNKEGNYSKLYYKLNQLLKEAEAKYPVSQENATMLSKIKDEYLSANSSMLLEANKTITQEAKKVEESEKNSSSSSKSGAKSASSSKIIFKKAASKPTSSSKDKEGNFINQDRLMLEELERRRLSGRNLRKPPPQKEPPKEVEPEEKEEKEEKKMTVKGYANFLGGLNQGKIDSEEKAQQAKDFEEEDMSRNAQPSKTQGDDGRSNE